MSQQGPEEVTGRFETRQELSAEVLLQVSEEISYKAIAKDCGVSLSTLYNIIKQSDSEEREKMGKLKRKIFGTTNWKYLKLTEEKSL